MPLTITDGSDSLEFSDADGAGHMIVEHSYQSVNVIINKVDAVMLVNFLVEQFKINQ